MDKTKLNERYLIVILTLFTLGSTTVLSGISSVKTDIYLVFIIASILSIPLYYLYSCIYEKCIDKGIFNTIEEYFGKYISKIILFLYILFGLLICMISSAYSVSLVKDNDLQNTPKLFIAFFLVYLCYKSLKYKPIVIAKWCMLFFPLIVIAVISPTILSFNLFKVTNLFPMFQSSIGTLSSSTIFLLAIPFGESLMSFNFLIKNGDKNINVKKVLFSSLTISFIIILSIYLRNVLILGGNGLATLDYPTYLSTSLIKIGDYFQRFEVLVTTSMILNNYIKLTLIIYFLNDAIKYLFNITCDANLYAPITLLIVGVGIFWFVLINFNIFSTTGYYTISAIFTIAVPIILTLIAFIIDCIKKRNKGSNRLKKVHS